MITEEWAKNPKAEIKVKCQFCNKQHEIKSFLREEVVPLFPFSGLIEAVWVCPTCEGRKHAYYLTSELKKKQKELKELLAVYNSDHSSASFDRYRQAQKAYQKLFDHVQALVAERLKAVA